VQTVEVVYDERAASTLGVSEGQLMVMIHTGSRGLGHQVCTDYLDRPARRCAATASRYPTASWRARRSTPTRRRPTSARCAAPANFAFANRQVLAHWTRDVFERSLNLAPRELGLRVVYDVAHNIAKEEEHEVDGVRRRLIVHRKGATRAFPGQPVLVPGDMGRYSYLLIGTERAMRETFGSTCHGAGRRLSRTAAVKAARGRRIGDELRSAACWRAPPAATRSPRRCPRRTRRSGRRRRRAPIRHLDARRSTQTFGGHQRMTARRVVH
jgi:tRNA-splicing ligase RtcB